MKNILLIGALCLGAITAVNLPARADQAKAPSFFNAEETTVDLAITYNVDEPRGIQDAFDTDIRHGQVGMQLGGTYWPAKYFGSGFEAGVNSIHRINDHVIDYTSAVGRARLPIQITDSFAIAPEIFGAVKRDFDDGLYSTQLGARLNARFSENLGGYLGWRFEFERHKTDSQQFEAGAQLAF